jgi:hypothetical protein
MLPGVHRLRRHKQFDPYSMWAALYMTVKDVNGAVVLAYAHQDTIAATRLCTIKTSLAF